MGVWPKVKSWKSLQNAIAQLSSPSLHRLCSPRGWALWLWPAWRRLDDEHDDDDDGGTEHDTIGATTSTTTALVEALTTTTASSSSDTSGIIQNLVDVLTGKVATIALDQLSNLLGLNNPVPSPLSDPIGFLTHPLISPIILAAVTLNPPAMALAMGGLAGNLVLTHIFTIATEALVSTTVAAAI